MIPGNWDILLPAKVSITPGQHGHADVEYEVTHLTCFVGGMYGLGSKLFGREQDLEYAKKLTEGCVWAYQSTASGIMPERAAVVPCSSLERCSFNETIWKQYLDPAYATRDEKIREWELWVDEQEKKALLAEEQEAMAAAAAATKPTKAAKADPDQDVSPEQLKQDVFAAPEPATNGNGLGYFAQADLENGGASTQFQDATHVARDPSVDQEAGKEEPSMEKRAVVPENPSKQSTGKPITAADKEINLPVLKSEPEDPEETTQPAQSVPENKPPASKSSSRSRYIKPPTHEEFVAQRIAEGIPPGYSKVGSKEYILR